MKKSLIVVNQLFQLMVASQMRISVLKDEDVDLLLVDSSAGIRYIYDKIKNSTFFSRIYIISAEEYKNKVSKFLLLLYYLFDKNYKYIDRFDFNPVSKYSKVFINNFTHYACELAGYLNMKYGTQLYRFEEGLGTYLDDFSFVKNRTYYILQVKDFISGLAGNPQVKKILNGHFLFSPEIIQFNTNYHTYRIPHFDFYNKDFSEFLSKAYGLREENEFDRKYIFFEENIPDGTIDDFALVMKIAEKVGKENLIVKLHPRRPVDRFSNYGIKVSRSVGIPWEAFLMKYDFSDKVIMTISSSVAFSSRLYFNQPIKTYMLFRVVGDINPMFLEKEKYYGYIKSFRKQFNDTEFKIPHSIDDLLRQL